MTEQNININPGHVEITLAAIREKDRPLALKLLSELPDRRLSNVGLY